MLAAAPFYATTCGGIIRAELKKGWQWQNDGYYESHINKHEVVIRTSKLILINRERLLLKRRD